MELPREDQHLSCPPHRDERRRSSAERANYAECSEHRTHIPAACAPLRCPPNLTARCPADVRTPTPSVSSSACPQRCRSACCRSPHRPEEVRSPGMRPSQKEASILVEDRRTRIP